MNNLISIFLISNLISANNFSNSFDLFDSKNQSNKWYVINDDVMGGVSKGKISYNKSKFLEFTGKISIENNGGFSSIRLNIDKTNIGNKKRIALRVKGDKKKYQFRIKKNDNDFYSYSHTFKTNGKWEDIIINLDEFRPIFRGINLNMKNFSSKNIDSLSILVGNEKNEDFKLLIEKIFLIN